MIATPRGENIFSSETEFFIVLYNINIVSNMQDVNFTANSHYLKVNGLHLFDWSEWVRRLTGFLIILLFLYWFLMPQG